MRYNSNNSSDTNSQDRIKNQSYWKDQNVSDYRIRVNRVRVEEKRQAEVVDYPIPDGKEQAT